MISIRNIKTIFKKELLTVFKDKGVLFTNLFIPLFGLPLYFFFVMQGTNVEVNSKTEFIKDQKTIFNIKLSGDISKEMFSALKKDPKIKPEIVNSTINKELINNYFKAREQIQKYQNDIFQIKEALQLDQKERKEKEDIKKHDKIKYKEALVALNKKFHLDKDAHLHVVIKKSIHNQYWIFYFFHEENKISSSAKSYAEAFFDKYEEKLVKDFKKNKNIVEYDLNPIIQNTINLQAQANPLIKMLTLPIGYIIIILLLITIYNPTINTTIGEHDQNTYKVLLMNPVSPLEIFTGKYLAIAFQGIIFLIPYGMQATIIFTWFGNNFDDFDFAKLTLIKFILILLITSGGSILVSAISFLACSFVKTRLQAQSLLSIVIFSMAIPIIIITIFDLKLNLITMFIPISNIILSFAHILQNNPNLLYIVTAIMINLTYSILIILFTLNAFKVQWKGGSDAKTLSDILILKNRKTENIVPAHAFLAFILAFFGYLYASNIIATFNLDILTFLLTPIFCNLGISMLILFYSQIDLIKVFESKEISVFYLFKLILSAFLLSYMFNIILNIPALKETFQLEINFPDIFENNSFAISLSSFLLFALIPGLTEEILFRGIIFKGFRFQYNFIFSAVTSSLFFAIIHFSFFSWGHTFIIGLFLAYLYEKNGLISCMIFHIAFNSFGISFGMNDAFMRLLDWSPPSLKYAIFPIIITLSIFMLRVKKTTEQV